MVNLAYTVTYYYHGQILELHWIFKHAFICVFIHGEVLETLDLPYASHCQVSSAESTIVHIIFYIDVQRSAIWPSVFL